MRCEEYFAGDFFGADEDGELFKGIVCFMIVGLQSDVPYHAFTTICLVLWKKDISVLRHFILVKNVRNNLLNRKRFLFPSFRFTGFYDDITVQGGDISWRLLHQVREKDEEIEGNLKAAPAISSKVTNFYYFAFHQGLVYFQPGTRLGNFSRGLKFFGGNLRGLKK